MVGMGAWSSARALLQTPTAERLLLFELPSLLLTATAAAGLYLVGRGWPYREGESLYCARCGHPWSAEIARLHSECQECGAPWRWFGGRVRGRPVRRPGLVAGGAVLCLLWLAIVVLRTTAPARLARSSPTWLLIRTVELAPWKDARVQWDELMARALPASDEAALARAILQKRQRERSLPTPLATWFDFAVAGTSIPRPLAGRWFDEMFDVRLSVPERAMVGESVPFIARVQYLGGWLGVADQAQVLVGGLEIQGEERARGRDRSAAPATLFTRSQAIIDETVRPEKPGALSMRLRVYFFIGPPGGAVTFAGDGTPDLGPVRYLKRFDLERTIGIDQAAPAPGAGPIPRPPPGP